MRLLRFCATAPRIPANNCHIENERLPFELGWKTRQEVVYIESVAHVAGLIGQATSLITGTTATTQSKSRDLHGAF